MALDKSTLTTNIQNAFGAVETDIKNGKTAAQAQTDLATAIANAIDTYVKGASVNVTGVSTIIAPPGTAGGPCTGSASGSLS